MFISNLFPLFIISLPLSMLSVVGCKICIIWLFPFCLQAWYWGRTYQNMEFLTFIILPVCCQQIIYDIGTQFSFVQCFVTTDMFLVCKLIFFSGICRIFRDLAFGSVKTRFKGFWDIFSKICMRPWIRRYRFYWTFAPGGRLNYEAYNVDLSKDRNDQKWISG